MSGRLLPAPVVEIWFGLLGEVGWTVRTRRSWEIGPCWMGMQWRALLRQKGRNF